MGYKIKILIKRLAGRLGILKELFRFFWENKLWWMIPMVIVFILLGLLMVFAQSPVVAPFIYTLF